MTKLLKKKLPTPMKKPMAKAPVKPVAKVPAPKMVEKKQPDKVIGIGHNGGPVTISKEKLKSVISKIENIEDEISGLREDVKEVYTSAKGNGFDVKTIRTIVAARRRDKEKLRAEKELLNVYLMALDPELADVLS